MSAKTYLGHISKERIEPILITFLFTIIILASLAVLTNLHEYSLRVTEANRQIESASKMKSEFLANMSHEIRTPMNAILGFSKLLKDSKLTLKQKDYLDIIKVSGVALLDIINDVLDISKIESGYLALEDIEFNISEIVEESFQLLRPKLEGKEVNFNYDIDGDVPIYLVGDPNRIRQILLNILGNSIKFTDKGEVKLKVTVSERCDGGLIRIKFVITDTGIGIDKDAIPSLFKPFVQADMSMTRKYGGTGLGLSICKKLVEIMSGQIEVRSEVGKGSEFEFTLLLKEVDKIGISESEIFPDSANPSPRDAILCSNIKILVAEDSLNNQLLISESLKDLDCVIDTAGDGRTALDKLKSNLYSIAIIDIHMPIVNGIEVIQGIKNTAGNKTRIIAVTASVLPQDRKDAIIAGADAFIVKPVEPDLIKETVLKLINP